MLRRANDHEAAAFFLVERTMQRTRPRVGRLGLKALETPSGRIERDPIGRLRFRLEGPDGADGGTRPRTRRPTGRCPQTSVPSGTALSVRSRR